MRYTKKPVTIEAEQWCGTAKCLSELVSFTNGCCFLPMDADEAQLIIKSREGDVKADVGDYVIKGFTKDYGYHCWVCKPDYFKDAYEEMIGNETPSPSSPQILVDALEDIAMQKTTSEYDEEEGDLEEGYNKIIEVAREALSKFKQGVDGQDQDEQEVKNSFIQNEHWKEVISVVQEKGDDIFEIIGELHNRYHITKKP